MMKRIALPTALAFFALLGAFGHNRLLALGSPYDEVSPSIASELVGGVDCQHYGATNCGSMKTTNCPLTLGYEKAVSIIIPPGKPSGTWWCGCNKKCNGKDVIKSLIVCGS